MEKYTKKEIEEKLVNLCAALNDCDIPAEVLFHEIDGEEKPILFAALWDCNSGDGIRLEVSEDVGYAEGQILACANPIGCAYEELAAEILGEDEEEEEE